MKRRSASPLRVCIDARMVSGASGGVEQALIGIAEGLSGLDDGPEEYLFLTDPSSNAWIAQHLSGSCRLLPGTKGPQAPSWQRAMSRSRVARALAHRLGPLLGASSVHFPTSDGTIERAGVDVMHFPSQDAFLTDVPNLYHPHDLQHRHLPEYFTPLQRHRRDQRYRRYCAQAALVPVTSSWVRQDLIRQFLLPPDKVVVVPLGTVIGAYPEPTPHTLACTKSDLDLPDSFVLFPAQTWPHKNHIGLLDAIAMVRARSGLPVALVCSGTQNEHFPAIQRRAAHLGLAPHVHFVGFVSGARLRCLYRLSKLVCIPTRFEAGSFPMLEAFHEGVPVACSNVTSLPALAGNATLLFDPDDIGAMADCIQRLWTDDALRADLIAKGKLRVKEFGWARAARRFRACYRLAAGRSLDAPDLALLNADPLV